MNNLGIDLTGKDVVLKQYTHTGTNENILTRIFHCISGVGCYPNPHTASTIRGYFYCNPVMPKDQSAIIDANDIERLATEREVLIAK